MGFSFPFPRSGGSTVLYIRDSAFRVPVDWWQIVLDGGLLPIVVGFHGGNGAAEPFLAFLDPAAAFEGRRTPTMKKLKFCVICPEGIAASGTAWNSWPVGGDARLVRVDDGDFLVSLIQEVDSMLIDSFVEITGSAPPKGAVLDVTSIYLMGFSNGGQAAFRFSVLLPSITSYLNVPFVVKAVAGLSTSMGGWLPAAGYLARAPDYQWYPPNMSVLVVHGKRDFEYGETWDRDGVGEDGRAAADQLNVPATVQDFVRADISARSGVDTVSGRLVASLGPGIDAADGATTYGPMLLPAAAALLEQGTEWAASGLAVHFITKATMKHVMETPWEPAAVWSFFEAWGGL